MLVCRNNRSWFGFDHLYRVSFFSLLYIFNFICVRQFGVVDSTFSRKWTRRSQVRMTNLEGLIRASVRYDHLCYSRTTGLEDSKVNFSSILFETQFWSLFMSQMTNSRVSVSSERLLKGFHLICSSLQSDFIWVRGFAPCESCWYFSSAPVGKNLGLSQCSQHICQDCQRCKCESWRLLILL